MSAPEPDHSSREVSAIEYSVEVEDEAIILRDFREVDRLVVEMVTDANDVDRPSRVHRMLELGARCLVDAGSAAQRDAVQAEFEVLKSKMDHTVEDAVRQLGELERSLLGSGEDGGKEGAIHSSLRNFRSEFERLIQETFKEGDKSSAIGKFETLLGTAGKSIEEKVSTQLSLGDPMSPLSILKKTLTDEIVLLRESLAAKGGRKTEARKGHAKGDDYDDAIFAVVQPFGNLLGDEAVSVRSQSGALKAEDRQRPGKGGDAKVGDQLITVKPGDVGGRRVAYVIESKTESMSYEKAKIELREAAENRQASAAIIFFPSQEVAPTESPIQVLPGGHQVIAVAEWDEEGQLTSAGELAVRLACSWARAQAIHGALKTDQGSKSLISEEAIDAVMREIETGRSFFTDILAIKTNHTNISNALGRAGNAVTELEEKLRRGLDRIEAIFKNGGQTPP